MVPLHVATRQPNSIFVIYSPFDLVDGEKSCHHMVVSHPSCCPIYPPSFGGLSLRASLLVHPPLQGTICRNCVWIRGISNSIPTPVRVKPSHKLDIESVGEWAMIFLLLISVSIPSRCNMHSTVQTPTNSILYSPSLSLVPLFLMIHSMPSCS